MSDCYSETLISLLDKPLREVLKECSIIYINANGINLGHLIINNNLERKISHLEINSHTYNGMNTYPEISITRSPLSMENSKLQIPINELED